MIGLARRSSAAAYSNIVISKEELPVEIGFFDVVHVRHKDRAVFTAGQAHHGKVFEELASQSTSTAEEILLPK